ncbi:MAG TPA: pyridoxamine 5'-phosphate oxidase family protein [Pseudolabrys sp.]|jgi:general stress protein 26|nr:pyridoxamine 5'-phosphate oxidase family protein [Pseudolabrys sp.]
MPQPDIERVWDLMEQVRFCMLSTWDGKRLRARPMGAFVRRAESAIYFFTDARAHKDGEIERFPQVCVAFADPGGQNYVSVSGSAEISTDRAKIEELWAIPAKVWWKTPDNPNLRLIKVTPHDAEFWDSPGNVISSIKVAFALMKGDVPRHAGEHKKVTL